METEVLHSGKAGCKLENDIYGPSLHHYLSPASGRFSLKISLKEDASPLPQGAYFPFLVISDSDPLVRLIDAKFVTDAGREITRLFLMVQKDQYHLTRDDLWPMTNRDVDLAWQKTFSFYTQEEKDESLKVLSQQINRSGTLTPFRSLFFCKTRQVFFPPPCPRCGSLLERCDNDDLLTRSGLQPYSTSSRRYLFCPFCSLKEESGFYVYELESSDPPTLKDRWNLIKEFAQLIKNGERADILPCVECSDRQSCFGPDQQGVSRIVPFSFYPFYMLVFEGMALHSVDFLALLSGASFEEVEHKLKAKGESGRIRCLKAFRQKGLERVPFLFHQEDRYFLEVLYLKLSFLGELARTLLPKKGGYRHPDLRPSIHKIWLQVPDPTGFLPFFWNFRVKVIDIARAPREALSFPELSMSGDFQFIGLVWFYTLLVNKRQDISEVYSALGKMADQLSSAGNQSAEKPPGWRSLGVFRPENVFWNPDGREIRKHWVSLWERALELGWLLIMSDVKNDASLPGDDFWQEFENVREEVRQRLFGTGPPDEQQVQGQRQTVSAGGDVDPLQDQAIHDVLTGILKKWSLRTEPPEREIVETVILSREGTQTKGARETKEEVPETIIFSPGGRQGQEREVSGIESALKRNTQHVGDDETAVRPTQEDFLSETVILKPGKDLSKPGANERGRIPVTSKVEEEAKEVDALAETVMLRPGQDKGKKKNGNKG